jgi:hypothetical protein
MISDDIKRKDMKAETVLNKLCEIKYRVDQICYVWIKF